MSVGLMSLSSNGFKVLGSSSFAGIGPLINS